MMVKGKSWKLGSWDAGKEKMRGERKRMKG